MAVQERLEKRHKAVELEFSQNINEFTHDAGLSLYLFWALVTSSHWHWMCAAEATGNTFHGRLRVCEACLRLNLSGTHHKAQLPVYVGQGLTQC